MTFILILFLLGVIVLLILKCYPPIGDLPGKEKQREYAEKTDLYYQKKFHNENEYTIMTGPRQKEDKRTVPEHRIPVQQIDRIDHAGTNEMKVIWLGHSTSLVQMGGKNIFLDPVLGEYCAPVSLAGFKRFSDIALDYGNVPEIDVVFISHDHYDHLDYDTIKAIDSKVRHYVVPLGIDVILKG